MAYPRPGDQTQNQQQGGPREQPDNPSSAPRPGVGDPPADLPGYEDPVNPDPPQDPQPPNIQAQNPYDPNDTANYSREAPDADPNQRQRGGRGIQDQERPTGI
jgi:hypothetical protein